ncbi:MAG: hypothetical protein HZB61_09530 [Nitrospirae bacterium]|nr:hypothetical protein [Nitrospirota bacterium]
MTINGVEQSDNAIPLVDDRQEHAVEVRIPSEKTEVSNTLKQEMSEDKL